jgi:hypothetical protein
MRSSDFDTQFYIFRKNGDGTYSEIASNDDAYPAPPIRTEPSASHAAKPTAFGDLGQSQRGHRRLRHPLSDNLSKPALVATNVVSALKSRESRASGGRKTGEISQA